jgi:hypothetical protein
MTRAQLAVAVVNEALPGGWLEFLGRVELDGGKFDDAAERENRAETAADDVVGAVVEETSAPVATHGDATAISKVSSVPAPADAAVKACAHCTLENAADASACVACGAWWCPRCPRCVPEAVACCDVCGYPESADNGAQQASPNDAVDAPVAEKAAADADTATTPSEAEPMKVLQSIWDASAVATAARGDLRFMPFFELDPSSEQHDDVDARAGTDRGGVEDLTKPLLAPAKAAEAMSFDPSKLALVRTLKGHSHYVRCGVHCTLVMMCLRRRSRALPCFRTGGASCLGRPTTRSRSGTWRPANAWRR